MKPAQVFVLGALAACGRKPSATCDLDRDTIARWLVTSKFGDPGEPGSPSAGRWTEELSGVAFMLDTDSILEWCSAHDPAVDSACWTTAGDARRECVAARVELETVSIGGPYCAYELKTLAVDWLVAADGGASPTVTRLRFRPYAAASNAYADRLGDLPGDQICTVIGGLLLRCYRDANDARCAKILEYVRGFLPAPEQ